MVHDRDKDAYVLEIACKHYIELKSKHPKLSKFWMFAFFRENKEVLKSKFQDVYDRYDHTNFCNQKLTADDYKLIEIQFLEVLKRGEER